MSGRKQPPFIGGDEMADVAEEFDACDADGDRRIDFAEFSQLLDGLGTELPPAQQRARFDEIDKDQDGAIDRQEFLDWWRRARAARL
jgi:Ca2+-binding EF-hand superfamily protein